LIIHLIANRGTGECDPKRPLRPGPQLRHACRPDASRQWGRQQSPGLHHRRPNPGASLAAATRPQERRGIGWLQLLSLHRRARWPRRRSSGMWSWISTC